jgi:hypothetical protein
MYSLATMFADGCVDNVRQLFCLLGKWTVNQIRQHAAVYWKIVAQMARHLA